MSGFTQQFGSVRPGRRFASATGVTSDDAEPIYTKYTIFETVAFGGIARLPASNASAIELVVLNRGANVLSVIPDAGGQIENFGTDATASIAVGADATFVCMDPIIAPGHQWWMHYVPAPLTPVGLIADGGFLILDGTNGWPASSNGLQPGQMFSNGLFCCAVTGLTPQAGAAPIFFPGTTASLLLLLGAAPLPLVEPTPGSTQLWLNGGFVCIA